MAALSGALPADTQDLGTQDLGVFIQSSSIAEKNSFKEDQVCMFLGLFKETVVLFLARVSHLPCPLSSPASEVITSFSSSPHGSVLILLTYLFLPTSAAASLPSLPFYDHLFTPALLAPGKDAGGQGEVGLGPVLVPGSPSVAWFDLSQPHPSSKNPRLAPSSMVSGSPSTLSFLFMLLQ